MLRVLNEFGLEVIEYRRGLTLFTIIAQPSLITRVIGAQSSDEEAESYRAHVLNGNEIEN